MKTRTFSRALAAAVVVPLVAACSADSPTSPPPAPAAPTAMAAAAASFAPASEMPTGERIFGQVAIEPAYNADSGELMYLLTPIHAPLPSKANAHAVSPLYLVEYPADADVGVLNCMGVPGNCPDHDGLVAQVAMDAMPDVYGSDPTNLGHDHVADPPGGPDFNIAWEVIEVVFTSKEAARTHLTTDAQIETAVAAGDATEIDLGFAFNCNVVPATLYWKGTPVAPGS